MERDFKFCWIRNVVLVYMFDVFENFVLVIRRVGGIGRFSSWEVFYLEVVDWVESGDS